MSGFVKFAFGVALVSLGFSRAAVAGSRTSPLLRAAQTLSDLADRETSLSGFEYSESCSVRPEGTCLPTGPEAIAAEWQHSVSSIGRRDARDRLGRNGLSDALRELVVRARGAGPYVRCENHFTEGKTFQRRVVFVDRDGQYCPSFTLGYDD